MHSDTIIRYFCNCKLGEFYVRADTVGEQDELLCPFCGEEPHGTDIRAIDVREIRPSILNFEKPKKVMSKESHDAYYSSDCGVPGTYTPNMSSEDNNKWKAKYIRGENERVEIRKNLHAQTVTIVYKSGNVRFSSNSTVKMTAKEWEQLMLVVREAIEVMSRG